MINFSTHLHPTSKDWVTFVHGAGGSSSIWFRQVRAFRKHFNILLVDLRGHGDSDTRRPAQKMFSKKYTFPAIAEDILEVLDHLKIERSHFIGISLGCILIRQIAETHPERIQSMVMGGAILRMNFSSRILMFLGNTFKYILPYLMLYRLFAFTIMPRSNHRQSRNLFIREAKKLYQKEFIKWFRLTYEINPLLRAFRQVEVHIPTLYIMGEEDHMFLPSVQEVVRQHHRSSRLVVLEDCGHVVNVDQAEEFNQQAISYLLSLPA